MILSISATMESAPTNLLPSLADVAVEVPPEEAPIGASPAEQFYVAHNRSVLSLAVLCIGLRNSDGNLMLDPAKKPWKSMKKETINPSTKDMQGEIRRRWEIFDLGDKPLATKYWDKKLNFPIWDGRRQVPTTFPSTLHLVSSLIQSSPFDAFLQ
jgi:hypothetical protein